MRIITGLYKGRHFDVPRTFKARPTTDFAKENIFNVLNGYIDFDGCKALDLFAGTGSISYELVSRGAAYVTSVEMAQTQLTYIHKVCGLLKIDNMRVVKQEVFRFVESTQVRYDLIFADPPYQLPNIKDLPDAILSHNHLKDGGLLIVEHGAKTSFEEHPCFYQHRNYGNVHFTFFRCPDKKEEATE